MRRRRPPALSLALDDRLRKIASRSLRASGSPALAGTGNTPACRGLQVGLRAHSVTRSIRGSRMPRLLDLTLPTPEENLALDEALLLDLERAVGASDESNAEETLRFWESPVPFVVIGS